MVEIEILEQQAVDSAINLHWQQAINLNKDIIKQEVNNLAAHLRLGFAYLQTGNIQLSKRHYNKALKIQPKNIVALDNLERIKVIKKSTKKIKNKKLVLFPHLFIETPGKTKTVALVNLGQKNVIASLIIGQQIDLKIKRRKVEVRSNFNDYIGNLPDDLSRRLIFFFKAKSKYSCFIKEASLNRVVVFIREEQKGKPLINRVSFPLNPNKQTALPSTDEESKSEEDDSLGHGVEDWEKLVNELGEENKEDLVGVHTEDLEEQEEED